MITKSCREKLKKVFNNRVDGVNLIGKDVKRLAGVDQHFTKNTSEGGFRKFLQRIKTISSYIFRKKEDFVPILPPTPLLKKIRSSAATLTLVLLVVSLSYLTVVWLQKVLAADPNPYTWDFASSADYVVSDADLIEVTDGQAELKVRNYITDGNTRALYHLDTLSGATAVDSSGNENTGIIAGGSWVPGLLNGALEFNGYNASVTAPDSATLSVTGNITLEGWTQFSTAFSANSRYVRQPIISKGGYALYYDNETGKVAFELASSPSPSPDWTWVQAAGGIDGNVGSEVVSGGTGNGTWDFNGKPSVHAIVKMGADIYVGLGSYTTAAQATPSDAEVWKYDTTTSLWSLVGGDGIGWIDQTYEDVLALATDGSNLYAALGSTPAGDGELYKWDGTTWTKIGGDSSVAGSTGPSSWTQSIYEAASSVIVAGTGSSATLVVGLGLSAGDAEVWKCRISDGCTTSSGWKKIGGDSAISGSTGPTSWYTSTYEIVPAMAMWNNSLIVALGASTGDAEVWKCTDIETCNTTSGWKIIGEYPNPSSVAPQSWVNNTFEIVTGLYVVGDDLYVGLGNSATTDARIWRCNLSMCRYDWGWTQIATSALWGTAEQVWGITGDSSYIYAGLGNSLGANNAANDSEIWRFTISSGFTNPVWGLIGGSTAVGYGIPFSTQTNVRSLLVDGTTLYAGMQNQSLTNTGEVWTCSLATPTSCVAGWTLIGGNYVNKSWGYYNMQSAEASTTVNGKLYIGTGNNVNGNANIYGNATVWEYNDTASYPQWSMIGGQSVNGSWPYITTLASASSAPYEGVFSMTGYGGKLYVGLGSNSVGTSTRDAEVWGWETATPSKWAKVAGDTVNTSWDTAAEVHETVRSLGVHYCSGSATNYCLFAGLGDSSNDAEVWEYNGTGWTIRGGDSWQNWNSNGGHEYVQSMVVYNNKLYAGVSGTGGGEAEVWRWNGTGSSWSMIGGQSSAAITIGGSWDQPGEVNLHETVDSMAVFRGELYVGLGYNAGDAEVWNYDGTTWTLVGGDNTGWENDKYERVLSLKVYNGELYAGLGSSQYDAEVLRYRFDGSAWSWTKIGGDDTYGSWTDTTNYGRERVSAMSVYRGKLYAATGDTGNNDAAVWAFGNNYILNSTAVSQDTDWHHIAATYDGSYMRLYLDGVAENSSQVGLFTIFDSTASLGIGTDSGTKEPNHGQNYFSGKLDEIRISDAARTSFNSSPYTTESQTVRPVTARFTEDVGRFETFSASENGSGTFRYRISTDGGGTWKRYSSGWVTSSSISENSTATQISDNLPTLPININPTTGDSYGILWQAILTDSTGENQLILDNVQITVTEDNPPVTGGNPNIPTAFTSLNASGGSVINSGTWNTSSVPYFYWSGADDDTDGGDDIDADESGVAGYWVYFGPSETGDPSTQGTFQLSTDENYTPASMTSGETYYLRIQVQDKAGNLSSVFPSINGHSYFEYKFDNEAPTDPDLRVTPETVSRQSQTVYFEWNYLGGTQASDCDIAEDCSGISYYEFKTGTTEPASDFFNWQNLDSAISSYTSPAGNIAYKEGANYFYLRTVDMAGNSSPGASVVFAYNGSTPEAVGDLQSDPVTTVDTPSVSNDFTFTWDAPENYSLQTGILEYIYTINVEMPAKEGLNDCIASGDCRVTSLTNVSDILATRQVPLANTFYVVARDTQNGNYELSNVSTMDFYVETPAPGIPRNIDIADVSVKTEESWKLALSWEAPTEGDIARYEIYRSDDDVTYSEIGSTQGGIAYFDVGLEQQTYYYKVRACDDANSCGSFTSSVSMYPTGKYTSAAGLSAEPEVTEITTKRATISWSTDRDSDSKIAYGKGSDDYFDSEPSNSTQTTDHEIALTDLSPGTKYYFVTKWTDEDGNTGASDEVTFETQDAPTVSDPKVKTAGIDTTTLEYTVTGASKVRIYYGETSAFGGTVDLSTSTDEATYTTTLTNLKDGVKYYYKINTYDSEDDEYDGSILTFETLPRPKIEKIQIQQVKGTAQPTALVVWETNTEVSSIVTYYPQGDIASSKDIVNVAMIKGRHRMIVQDLNPQTPYSLVVSGRDKAGNEARSDLVTFTTATDTRPPLISNLKVEGAIVNVGGSDQQKLAQLMVSWDTDEAATSQIDYGEGSGTTYSQRTQEDTSFTFNHVVVISNLVPSRVYHLKALSKDSASNEGFSIDTVTITPKATDSALDLVISNLGQVFGFLNGLTGK